MKTNAEMETLPGKLQNIERGARAFGVLAVIFVVLGCVTLLPAGLELLKLLRGAAWMDVMAEVFQRTMSALQLFVLAWLSQRARDAFESIAGLIGEIGEIV